MKMALVPLTRFAANKASESFLENSCCTYDFYAKVAFLYESTLSV